MADDTHESFKLPNLGPDEIEIELEDYQEEATFEDGELPPFPPSDEFDAWIDKADATPNIEERDKNLQEATKVAIRDIVLIPVHYEQDLYATKKNVDLKPRMYKFIWAYEIDIN